MTEERSNERKKALFKILQNYVDAMKKTRFWAAWGLLLVGVIVLDCCPYPYINDFFGKTFSYDIGHLISIIVVSWTFTVTIGMYCLSQLETQYYGVRIMDVFFRVFTLRRAVALVLTVASVMLLLIVSTIMEWEITVTVIAFLQFHVTCFTFAVVCLYFTRTAVILMAQKEIQNVFGREIAIDQVERETKVAVCVARNTDYGNEDEKNALYNILEVVSVPKDYVVSAFQKDSYTRKLCEILVDGMLNNNANYWKQVYPLIAKWYFSTDNLSVKNGVIQALVENYHTDKQIECYLSCKDLVESEKQELFGAVGAWALTYYWYSGQLVGQEWKRTYCRKIVKEIPDILLKNETAFYLEKYCNMLRINRHDLEKYIGCFEKEDEEDESE